MSAPVALRLPSLIELSTQYYQNQYQDEDHTSFRVGSSSTQQSKLISPRAVCSSSCEEYFEYQPLKLNEKYEISPLEGDCAYKVRHFVFSPARLKKQEEALKPLKQENGEIDDLILQLIDFRIESLGYEAKRLKATNLQKFIEEDTEVEKDRLKERSEKLRSAYLKDLEDELFSEAFKFLDNKLDVSLIARENTDIEISREYFDDLKINFETSQKLVKANVKARKPPNNVVLVNIFARENEKIKKDKQGEDEIHTICLWKVGKKKVRIIDPSNLDYLEKHFPKDRFLKKYGWELELEYLGYAKNVKDKKFYIGSENPQQSTEDQLAGPSQLGLSLKLKSDDPRDCIDIAVKIAFQLNEAQQICDEEAKILNSIKTLSNCNKVNPYLNDDSNQIYVRALQCSVAKIRARALEALALAQWSKKIKIKTIEDLNNLADLKTCQDRMSKVLEDELKNPTIKKFIDSNSLYLPWGDFDFKEKLQSEQQRSSQSGSRKGKK